MNKQPMHKKPTPNLYTPVREGSWLSRWFYLGSAKLLAFVALIWAFAAKPQSGKYDLSHLVQYDSQHITGQMQDDDAFLLFAAVRGMRMRAVLEVGGLAGFSALNFLRALPQNETNFVATVDILPINKVGENHEILQKDVAKVKAEDLQPLFDKYSLSPCFDLVFFDAHIYEGQTALLENLKQAGMVDGKTVIALHDTFLHPHRMIPWGKYAEDNYGTKGYEHCEEERQMIRDLRAQGYHSFQLHPRSTKPGKLSLRDGITLMQMPQSK